MVLDFIICDGLNSLHFFAVSTDIQTTSCPTNPSLDQFILISNGMEMHEVRSENNTISMVLSVKF